MNYAAYCRLNVPVTASTRDVIRAAMTRISPAGHTREMRVARHAYLRRMLDYHARALTVYRAAMDG